MSGDWLTPVNTFLYGVKALAALTTLFPMVWKSEGVLVGGEWGHSPTPAMEGLRPPRRLEEEPVLPTRLLRLLDTGLHLPRELGTLPPS